MVAPLVDDVGEALASRLCAPRAQESAVGCGLEERRGDNGRVVGEGRGGRDGV